MLALAKMSMPSQHACSNLSRHCLVAPTQFAVLAAVCGIEHLIAQRWSSEARNPVTASSPARAPPAEAPAAAAARRMRCACTERSAARRRGPSGAWGWLGWQGRPPPRAGCPPRRRPALQPRLLWQEHQRCCGGICRVTKPQRAVQYDARPFAPRPAATLSHASTGGTVVAHLKTWLFACSPVSQGLMQLHEAHNAVQLDSTLGKKSLRMRSLSDRFVRAHTSGFDPAWRDQRFQRRGA